MLLQGGRHSSCTKEVEEEVGPVAPSREQEEGLIMEQQQQQYYQQFQEEKQRE
jgi:hypothetical protein